MTRPRRLPAQIEEIEIIATDLAGLQAQSGIFKGFGFRADLRKQARLHLFGDFDFLSSAAFGLVFLSESTPLGFHAPGEFVEASKTERVAVGIFETGVDSSPLGNVWRIEEVNAAGAPFVVFARYVFGDEPNDSLLVNERLDVGLGFGERQADVCIAVGGSDFNPASPVFECVVYGDTESELIDVEPQAAFLVADVNDNKVQAQVGILPVEAERGSVNAEREFGASHRRDYKGEPCQERKECRTSLDWRDESASTPSHQGPADRIPEAPLRAHKIIAGSAFRDVPDKPNPQTPQ